MQGTHSQAAVARPACGACLPGWRQRPPHKPRRQTRPHLCSIGRQPPRLAHQQLRGSCLRNERELGEAVAGGIGSISGGAMSLVSKGWRRGCWTALGCLPTLTRGAGAAAGAGSLPWLACRAARSSKGRPYGLRIDAVPSAAQQLEGGGPARGRRRHPMHLHQPQLAGSNLQGGQREANTCIAEEGHAIVDSRAG
jgi:hypothetical protein